MSKPTNAIGGPGITGKTQPPIPTIITMAAINSIIHSINSKIAF
jgi:hypothetical protein